MQLFLLKVLKLWLEVMSAEKKCVDAIEKKCVDAMRIRNADIVAQVKYMSVIGGISMQDAAVKISNITYETNKPWINETKTYEGDDYFTGSAYAQRIFDKHFDPKSHEVEYKN